MKKKLFIFCFLLPFITYAQEPLHYWGKTDLFMEEQTKATFQFVKELLKETSPSPTLSIQRKSALMHLDWIYHDPRLDKSPQISQFLSGQIRAVLADLEQPVKKGVKIYKLYNHAFIAKSPTVTIAFDMTRAGQGERKNMITDELMDSLVQKCDVLFVSHRHGDHADQGVAEQFIKHKKNVVVPTGLWENKSEFINHLRSEEILKKEITLSNGKKLNVKVMPGHQDDVPNNVYIVSTPENINIAHTGDEWNKEKDQWITTVKDHTLIDILLVHCWAMPLENFINGFNPKLVISGHENEIVHSIDHREPYWLNYRRMKKVTQPIVYMTWGEHYLYKK
jgi:hypothetical protein